MTPEQEKRVKELLEIRREISHTNFNHRAAKSRCHKRIEHFKKAIALEQLDIKNHDILINANQLKLEEAGREIQAITGESIIKWKSK